MLVCLCVCVYVSHAIVTGGADSNFLLWLTSVLVNNNTKR